MGDSITIAIAYYTNGANFQASARKLQADLELDDHDRPTSLAAIPLYFLASHAAELFLKAALLKRGFSESKLRQFDYRHDLKALMQELQAKEVPVSRETEALVIGLSEQHQRHTLRYTVLEDDGTSTFWPPLCSVFSALDELLLACRISTHGI